MKIVFLFVSLVILGTAYGCRRLKMCEDQKLSLKRTSYSGAQLRIDGYYYGDPSTSSQGVTRYETIVFYQNGIVLFPGNKEMSKIESEISATVGSNAYTNVKYSWGIFNIESTTIKLDYWRPTTCGYPAVLRTGNILNDTTFVLTTMEVRDKKGATSQAIDQTFHFKQYGIKPDSTNKYID